MARRKKQGRPRESLDGGLRKPHIVRFSDAEWRALAKLARKAEVTRAEWIRRRSLSS